MTVARKVSMLLPVFLLFSISGQRPLMAEEADDIEKTTLATWEKISELGVGEYEKYETGSNDPQLSYWSDITGKGFFLFRDLVADGDVREKMRIYEEQFGEHGAAADIRWILAFHEGLIDVNCLDQLPDRSKEQNAANKAMIEAAEAVAEFQVKRFLRDPDILNRYCHLTVWLGGGMKHAFSNYWFIGQGKTRRGLQNPDAPRYWWYARSFVVTAYLTGRRDFLDTEPDKLGENAEEFYRWLFSKGSYLQGAKDDLGWVINEGKDREPYVPFILQKSLPPLRWVPEKPFEDWGDLPELPREVFGP